MKPAVEQIFGLHREGGKWMHIVVRHYEGVRNMDQMERRFRDDFAPLITGIRGCRGYYLVDAGGGKMFTVSIFDDAAGTQESVRVAADWIKNHSDVLPHAAQVASGEVKGHHTVK